MLELETLFADAGYVVSIAKLVATTAAELAPFIEAAYEVLILKQPLTDAQRAALAAQETAMRNQLNAPSIAADAS